MLRLAIRRLLFILPTLIAVSVVTFLFLSYVPDPTDDPALAVSPSERARLRRERFLDLPRFVNLGTRDVRTQSAEAMRAIVDGDAAKKARGQEELARLGGAALPHVLPALDSLAPGPRAEVALALAPVGERMGFSGERLADPARAVAFWTRFWDDRGIEFRRASVRSAVRRLSRYGSTSRAAELRELDTFVLEDVLGALEHPTDAASFERARALVDIAAHVTGRDDRISPGDDHETARACVERWGSFWMVYKNDFVTLDGPSRIAAIVLETRYGKWALGAITRRLGVGIDGVPVLDGIFRRAPVTLTLVFGSILLAYAAAVPIGLVGAASRGRRRDGITAAIVLVLYAIPTAFFAILAARGYDGHGLLLPTVVLALGLVAAPARQARAGLASAFAQDHVRASLARGASRARALMVHALPGALLPVVTLATLEAPMALGGAFVVERVFGLEGLGAATIVAVQSRDTSWLMAVSIFTAATATLGVIMTDLVYTALDPRLAQSILRQRPRT
ncbi:ABC transporter permease subunit [Polyangium jinanense]|uniref:ABC transporter permease subunit n=1 Tax=Polyangium jinanense TaxID=2829994 RepID=A0A9X4AWB2_9BACT|nr:ABC transporter permease subunit [Polyangium jinanense]MDC3955901.1 ABC transporter permease subunit [Polyangium jinanense]MDC3983260.1 ABC transporter permease subunit [Polyangium jinanense]MDC3985160.1 ABC transporter permease subunit [Polyangium jinanense]